MQGKVFFHCPCYKGVKHGERRDLGGGRGAAPVGGDGECPGGNPRSRWRSTDMEAGGGWRGGADGRKGIHTESISDENGGAGRAGGGGPRGMGAAVGRPGAGALRATRPAPGAAAGGRAVKGATSTVAWHRTLADNKNTRLDRGQDNGELSDMAQKDGTIQIHTPLRSTLGIITCNSDNKLLG